MGVSIRVDGVAGPAIVSIYEASKVIGAATDIDRGLRDLVNLLPSLWGMTRVTITLRKPGGDLEVAAQSWVSPAACSAGKVLVLRALAAPVLSFGLPQVVPDAYEDPAVRSELGLTPLPEPWRLGLIGVPIKAGGIPLGVLVGERSYRAEETITFEADVRVMAVVSNLIGQALCAHKRQLAGDEFAGSRCSSGVAAGEKAAGTRGSGRQCRSGPDAPYRIESVIGLSWRMQQVFAELHKAAPTRTTILLRGDSGTGKEMLARAIHALSPRRTKPFVKLNCAALSETLLESELFGHERGAFTGATGDRKGRFEQAHGGTLFLDEIGEISPAFQSKLLRVLQEGEFERVGGSRTLEVDVRLVAATNRNLEEAVIEGKFRADLYYRLNVVPIFLPPLRERREDIPALVDHFVRKFNEENRRELRFSDSALRVMAEECSFPGNVRELENCVRRVLTMAGGEVVETRDFPCRNNQCATPLMARLTLGKQGAAVRADVPAPVPVATPAPPMAGDGRAHAQLDPAADRLRPAQASDRRQTAVTAGREARDFHVQVRRNVAVGCVGAVGLLVGDFCYHH